ncbi:hypothetical protein [uncultured Clostridium sp.]|jgi:hypothetical protein|uniref:hypothetical protein n=1 Tax=uncultured Clostridium sp. TaxID=59620 RepID=UPI002636D85D|nr:hypothetical protein [uncultured Clostridium sp.]
MYIDKALKKQKAGYKRFNIVMIFMLILLPIVVFGLGMNKGIANTFLVILEIAIVLCMVVMKDRISLSYTCENNLLRLKQGIFKSYRRISCDKIKLIHTANKNGDIDIVIVTTTRIGNRQLRLVGRSFLNKYPMAGKEYKKLKKINPDKNYFYLVIKNGGYQKYVMLDAIYRNSVTATFTADTIENIKISRSQREV